jgi:hypothetical protein
MGVSPICARPQIALSRYFSIVIKTKLPKAWHMRIWLQKCCQAVGPPRHPDVMDSPIGLPVLQSAFAWASKEIQSRTVDKLRIKCHLNKATDKIDHHLSESKIFAEFRPRPRCLSHANDSACRA